MMIALYLLLVLGILGAFDTLWYHEYQQQLPRNASARIELRLHAARDFAYALVFGSLGWIAGQGLFARLFLAILLFEIGITLWDFIEEDMTRRLPAGERVMHTIMAIVYGAFLAHLLPQVFQWAGQPTHLVPVHYGLLSWILSAFAAGVFLSGVRDVVASFRLPEQLPQRESSAESRS
jgi:uncharacterized protein